MRKAFYVAALLLWVAVIISGQQAAKPAANYRSLGHTQEDFGKAVGFSQVISSSDKKEYFIVPKSMGATEPQPTPPVWSYGDASLKGSTAVEIQVGTKNTKPVYLPVVVPKGQAESASKNLKNLIEGAEWLNQSEVQSCSDGRECVRTCTEGKETYCCQWKCK